MEAHRVRRSRRREQRQGVLLGAIAVLAVLAVGLVGALRLDAAAADLRDARSRFVEPLRHLTELERLQPRVTGDYLVVLADPTAAAEQTARLGATFEAASAAWKGFRATALGLPAEADVADRVGSIFEGAASGQLGMDLADLSPEGRLTAIRNLGELAEPQHEALADLVDLYRSALEREDAAIVDATADAARETVLLTLVAAVALAVPCGAFARSLRRRARVTGRLEAERDRNAARTDFEARLQRGFDLVRTEADACHVVEDAAALVLPERRVELLLADSSRAHVREAAVHAPAGCGHTGCGVGSPMECPAATRGQTQEFTSSRAIDACPFLKDRPEGEVSATCVPVSIAGKTIGVLHSPGPAGGRLDDEGLVRLELVARKAGDRLGMLRAFARSETQARTDPLTGLVNRRSLEEDVRALVEDGRPYVVAFADLDRFKQLNDVHGHDTGDRALRLFARVLRDSVRPVDLPARYGGEEFVVVLPDCTLGDAAAVVERVRTRLAEAVGRGTVPAFTCSVGLASSSDEVPFATVVDLADGALLAAKAAGRDRTVVAGDPPPARVDALLN